MPPGLAKLLSLRFRATLRRLVRGMKTVRGAFFWLVGAGVFLLWIGPSLVMFITAPGQPEPEGFRRVFPLAMLGFALLHVIQGSAQKSIHFQPAEVDFLFSGPFTRRQLLLYKLAATVPANLLGALFFSVYFTRYSPLWIASFAGLLLVSLLLQLLAMASALVSETIGEYAYNRVRRGVLVVVFAVIGIVLWRLLAPVAGQDLWQVVTEFRESLPGRIMLAPFEPFSRTITAGSLFPELLGWGSLALGIDAMLLGLVMWLDVNYLESAIAVSQKLYQRVQRARRGGNAWASEAKARGRLPPFPRLGGAGPIAHSQLLRAMRGAPSLLAFVAILAGIMGAMIAFSGEEPKSFLGVLIGQMVFFTVIFARTLTYDFRGDLDHMDWLKTLPFSPNAMAAGELFAPVLFLTAIHLLLLAATGLFLGQPPLVLLAAGAFSLPFNALLFSLENLIFLLFPSRFTPGTAGSFQFFGRMTVETFVKLAILVLLGGLAAGIGALAYLVFSGSWVAAFVLAWAALIGEAAAMVPCLGWCFRRFDVSLDTPP